MGADVDRTGEATRDRAETGVKAMHPLGLSPALLRDGQPIVDPDPLDHKNAIFGLDLPDRFDLIALRINLDVTRFQRAGERAGQSPARRSNDIVKRRGMRRILARVHAIVLGDLRMNTERHRLLLSRKIREPLGAPEPLDSHPRHVAHLGHASQHTPSVELISGAWVSAGGVAGGCRRGRVAATPNGYADERASGVRTHGDARRGPHC